MSEKTSPSPGAPVPDETLDSIGTAGVRVLQRRGGYRFTLDAVLLAAFAATEGQDAGGPLLELG
ncbi:MAG TPA: SAM-dependent methyltransferase, partial [Myxococcaceae bacterium]|nr:SAM-dependent methyltransferase [Myxococcaceae bacterium]